MLRLVQGHHRYAVRVLAVEGILDDVGRTPQVCPKYKTLQFTLFCIRQLFLDTARPNDDVFDVLISNMTTSHHIFMLSQNTTPVVKSSLTVDGLSISIGIGLLIRQWCILIF
jgi:hypothetical protein